MTKTVLVVDDEPDVRLLCRVNLEFDGYRVIEAEDGEKAVLLMSALKPDVVLLDVMMPRMNGLDVLTRIVSDSPATPVIMLSAKVNERDRIRAMAAGACDYIGKPFNPVALASSVRNALRLGVSNEQRRVRTLEKMKLDTSL